MAEILGMGVQSARREQPWLRSARWDLSFLIFSVALAFVPYSIYLFLGRGGIQDATIKGTAAYTARLWVNQMVALLVGGPHMYATFTRTVMDLAFVRKRSWFIGSSLLVPAFVVLMAIYSYTSYVWLLTIFFAVASVHALQQIAWLSGAYAKRGGRGSSRLWQLVDYAVVGLSLYPIGVWKMVRGEFKIGPVVLKYGEVIGGWYWLAGLVFALFLLALGAFIVRTIIEYRAGCFNLPKTLLISATVLLMFWTPAFPNLDTAFQGVNTWHSFQYLALTWHANRLREQRTGRRLGFLHALDLLWQRAREHARQPGLGVLGAVRRAWLGIVSGARKLDRGTGWSTFYMLCLAMLPISGMLIMTAKCFWPHIHGDQPGSDEAYVYMGILSVLLVHYVHDALLFSDDDALLDTPGPAVAQVSKPAVSPTSKSAGAP